MHALKSKRGSVLIAALIFAAILAVALTTYLHIALGSGKIADRSYAFNSAQNFADTGIEMTLACLDNASAWTTGGFASRTGYLNQYQGTFPSSTTYYSLSRGAKGQAKVWVDNSVSPVHVVVRGIVTLSDGTSVSKYSEAYLQQRSYGSGGMVARNGIDFQGHSIVVDSWYAYDDDAITTNDTPYSTSVRTAAAHFSSPALISMQNAKVFGYAAIGSDDNSGLSVGATGILSGNFAAANGTVDYTRVTHDFTANFPDVTAPSGGTSLGAINSNTTITTGSYTASTINVNSKTINIGTISTPANVTLVVTGDVSLGGNSTVIINPGSTLTLYVAGDISEGGSASFVNGGSSAATMNMPSSFTLLGTRTAAQVDASAGTYSSWTIQGNTYLSAAIYAPNASITIGGNSDTYGSVVGNSVRMNSGNFHQDLSLANIRKTGTWGVTKWRELQTQSDRNTYSAQLTF